jgi:hypothetical protein
MNVLQTQNSLFRQMDAAAIVAQIQQAADQAQRQMALSSLRDARHRDASISQAENTHQSASVNEREHQADDRRPRGGKFRGLAADQDPDANVKDAPNIGPLGHHFDIIA